MDSIEKLVRFYNKSDESDMYHNVTGCILQNLHKVGKISIYDLADLCYSSPSTISRLVKKLHFENYTDFKSRILHALENYRDLNRNMREIDLVENEDVVPIYFNFLQNNIMALKDEIDYGQIAEISDYFYGADEIFLYSYPEVQVQALQKALIISGKKAYVYNNIAESQESVDQIKGNAVVFAIVPNLIEMSPIRGILKKASEKGATVISVCSKKENHYKKYSRVQISFTGTRTSMDLYLFMIVTNILISDYSHRYLNEMLEDYYS